MLLGRDLDDAGIWQQAVSVGADAGSGPLTLAATAGWLACKDICIPGKAELSLSLPVSGKPALDPDWAPSFAAARRALPAPARDWPAQFAVTGDSVSLRIESSLLDGATKVAFFPYLNDLVNHAARQRIASEGSRLRMSQAQSPYFIDPPASVEGVVVIEREGLTQAFEIAAQPGDVEPVSGDAGLQPAPTLRDAGPAADSAPGLLLVLAFAILGGLILNLMPCVFPVLSLKAIALVKHNVGDGGERRRQVYAYSAGVIVSCVAIAIALLALNGRLPRPFPE